VTTLISCEHRLCEADAITPRLWMLFVLTETGAVTSNLTVAARLA